MSPGHIDIGCDNNRWTDRVRPYTVLLDSQPVAKLRRGESVTIDAAPGSHTLQMKIDWMRSQPLPFEIDQGQTTDFRCWPKAHPLTALYWLTFGRSRYVGLEQITNTKP